jgi:delta-aminolevulinic acid dehydratase/porphobilinogen synthase
MYIVKDIRMYVGRYVLCVLNYSTSFVSVIYTPVRYAIFSTARILNIGPV